MTTAQRSIGFNFQRKKKFNYDISLKAHIRFSSSLRSKKNFGRRPIFCSTSDTFLYGRVRRLPLQSLQFLLFYNARLLVFNTTITNFAADNGKRIEPVTHNTCRIVYYSDSFDAWRRYTEGENLESNRIRIITNR